MNIPKNNIREASLDIALSVKDSLQAAIDSTKHGASKSNAGHPLKMKDLFYGGTGITKTVAINFGFSKTLTLMKWYSLCNVKVSDIIIDLYIDSGNPILYFSKSSMDLYSLTENNIIEALNSLIESTMSYVVKHAESEVFVSYKCTQIPGNVMDKYIRCDILDCAPGDWEVYEIADHTYTIFKGNKYRELIGKCNIVLSTNVTINIQYMGRVNSMLLYSEYVGDYNQNLYIALMCTDRGRSTGHDFNTIADDSPIKSITIKNQTHKILQHTEDCAEDNLTSVESILMSGASFENKIPDEGYD